MLALIKVYLKNNVKKIFNDKSNISKQQANSKEYNAFRMV